MLTASSGAKRLIPAPNGFGAALGGTDENAKKGYVEKDSVLVIRDIFIAASP